MAEKTMECPMCGSRKTYPIESEFPCGSAQYEAHNFELDQSDHCRARVDVMILDENLVSVSLTLALKKTDQRLKALQFEYDKQTVESLKMSTLIVVLKEELKERR